MSKPLFDALMKYAAENTARFHMPGHKGRMEFPFETVAPIDFTETEETGNLYTETDGAIRKSEKLMAGHFNAEHCLYLTGGATQGVFAALACVTKPGDTVLIDRCCHKSAVNAMAMLDLRPVYLTRNIIEPFGISDCLELPDDSNLFENAACLFVTNPTYYGVLSDLALLKKRYSNIPLIADGAHGAHLPFITSGFESVADIAIYSAHKTANALGQAAFIIAKDTVCTSRLRYLTSVFGTSSPSYPVMLSLDLTQHSFNDKTPWNTPLEFAENLRGKYSGVFRHTASFDRCRICVYTGDGYISALRMEREHGVVCEMADEKNVVFILSSHDTPEMYKRLERAIAEHVLPVTTMQTAHSPELPEMILTPRQAFFARSKQVKLARADGEISAEIVAPYPPGIPIIAPGEKFTKKNIEILCNMRYNRNDTVNILDLGGDNT